VTKGEITAYEGDDPKCRPTVYRAGEGFVDPGDGHVHVLRNETSAPAETVAVQILPKGCAEKDRRHRPGQLPVLTTRPRARHRTGHGRAWSPLMADCGHAPGWRR
jgi:hypothetical protein